MLSVMFEGEEYKFYDHLYAVSASGKFLRQLYPAEPVLRNDGYLSIGRQRLAHRLVAFCWVDNPNNYKHVHHINHDKSDNRASNLAWISPKEHKKHHPTKTYVRTKEHRERLRKLHLGTKSSEATKQKQRETNLRLGLLPPPPRQVRCSVKGVEYDSFLNAAKALGVAASTMRRRVLDDRYEDYKLI